MCIHHARYTIESEAVKLILLHPKSQIAEQETQDFMMTVIEKSAVPKLVPASDTLVEVLVVASVKLIQSVEDVLGSVAVYYVQQHRNAHAMGRVNQLFQIIWKSISAACRKEAVDLISKTRIVCMLHDRHELDDIVAVLLDSRQDIGCEFLVGGDFWIWRGDSNMGFVDASTQRLGRRFILEDVLRGWIPEPRIVNGREFEVLGYAGDPGWEPFGSSVVVGDYQGNLHLSA